jgi:hypothetical protein
MKLFIPACGDRVTLESPWTFDLYLWRRRNVKFALEHKLVDPKFDPWRDGYFRDADGRPQYGGRLKSVPFTIPAGAVLECDRVYIRTFSKSALEVGNDFDSISWKVMRGERPARNQRFWAKLPDCYEIEYSLPAGSLYRDRVKLLKLVHES